MPRTRSERSGSPTRASPEGYWRRDAETEATFRAFLADTGEGPFLRTGDLGFIRDGELYVTSRIKDLIIVAGANHYPQDIEWTVEKCHPDVRPSGVAAFSIPVDGEERLVVAAEIERGSIDGPEDTDENSRRDQAGRSREEHEVPVHAVLASGPREPAQDGQRQGPAPRLLAAARGGQPRRFGKLDRRHHAARSTRHHATEPRHPKSLDIRP